MQTLPLALVQVPGGTELAVVIAIALGALVVFSFLMVFVRRYKRCPSNRILVVYGKTSAGRSAKCLHGGGTFVMPLIRDYAYLSLDPMQIEIPLSGALSIENIRVNVPSVFTVAIGTDEEVMNNAAIRLLGLDPRAVMKLAEDMILGQLRQVIASMKIDEINKDRDTFLSKIQSSLEPELKKIGLVLLNVNIKDISDESGYIEAIGKKAASEAIQQAQVDVAHQEKLGAIGVANASKDRQIEVANNEKLRDIGTKEAERERAVRVAELEKERTIGEQKAAFEREAQVREAERVMRVAVAEANAKAVAGENKSKADIAGTNAELRVREADAYQIGETRQREAQAKVLEAQYVAQARAAEAQGKKIEAEKRAELESLARAVKAQTIVDAEAMAEKRRIEAEGEAAAIYARLAAQAKGEFEILAKKGDGLKRIIESCGGSQQAFQLLMLEHIDGLAKTAAQAISNVKFDKVVVWDGGSGKDGTNATGNFLRGVAGSLPPMMHMMKDIGGVEMPAYFGKLVDEAAEKAAQKAAESAAAATPAKP